MQARDDARGRVPNRGLLLFVLSAWITGTIFMSGVAAGNFAQVDLEKHPDLNGVFGKLSPLERVQGLRHVASEMNRRYFTVWSWVQIGLAAVALTILLRARVARAVSPWPLISVALMAAICLYLGIYVTPHMIEAGRAIDFVDRSQPSEAVAHFYRTHGMFMVVDAVKIVLAAGLSLWAGLPRSR